MTNETAPLEGETARVDPGQDGGEPSKKEQQHQAFGDLEAFLEGMNARLKPYGALQLVAIDPTGAAPVKTLLVAEAAEAAAWAKQENEAGRNIYYQPNPVRRGLGSKAKKADIAAALFCQVDIDPPKDGGPFDVEEVSARLAALPCPPTMIVSSGNGVQALWAFQEASHAV